MQDEAGTEDFLRTLKRVFDLAQSQTRGSDTLVEQLRAHLGADPSALAVFSEEFEPFEHPNLQAGLNAWLERPGVTSELIGIGLESKRYMGHSLSDIVARAGNPDAAPVVPGPVDYTNFHLADDRVMPCVRFGLYLVSSGDARLAVFIHGPTEAAGPHQKLRVEAMSGDPVAGQAFLADVTGLMQTHNVYRGHMVSIGVGQIQFGPVPQTLVHFHPRPRIARDEVVLPAALLERIERQALRFSEHADELLDAGRSLKRGMLLHGLPGTGKTLTVMYLAGQVRDRTVILTTGRSMGMVTSLAQMARTLAPAVLVLEDVDLIAEDRGNPYMRSNPVLFELLNEMDGIRNDADLLFVLTTNRPDVLEPALAARPGRVDLVAELPLPDLEGRQRLIELYGRGLDLSEVDAQDLAARSDGATPAYIKEMLRKALLIAAERGHAPRITAADVDASLAELAEGGRLAERLAGLRPEAPGAAGVPAGARAVARATGFPDS